MIKIHLLFCLSVLDRPDWTLPGRIEVVREDDTDNVIGDLDPLFGLLFICFINLFDSNEDTAFAAATAAATDEPPADAATAAAAAASNSDIFDDDNIESELDLEFFNIEAIFSECFNALLIGMPFAMLCVGDERGDAELFFIFGGVILFTDINLVRLDDDVIACDSF